MFSMFTRLLFTLGLLGLALFCYGQVSTQSSEATSHQTITVLRFEGAIGPAVSEYLVNEIVHANNLSQTEQPTLTLIVLDTPGGLVSSLRDINQTILASQIPIACFVAPAGARAMSAGTYILYACHIAAMAPATTLGAATPVQMGSPSSSPKEDSNDDSSAMERKVLNDAIAYIRSIAQLRGRNQSWAELAVKEAATLTAAEALEQQVIDLVADNEDQLIDKLNGWPLTLEQNTQKLNLSNAILVEHPSDWRNQLIATITNPNIAYILMLIGIYGLILEFYSPGIGLAGITGGIALIIAMYAFQMLPLNYAGLGLLLLGIVLLIAESMVPSFGLFGLGGVVAFSIGSLFLLDTQQQFAISLPLIAAVTLTSTLFSLWVLSTLWSNRRRPVVSGDAAIIGAVATVVEGFEQQGIVHLAGEEWAAISDTPTETNQQVRVIERDHLTLKIEPLLVMPNEEDTHGNPSL
ncbi:serine protease [Shewanella colwelliana]|uniref:NfeD family protein n=1 Tax=Shewanella colwelliana TaxID=23 RepID=UPI001BC0523A|nr:nodulation protein NfeD [Shewanella colwelliana]GIU24181.1 serine protease [Shewanella colwelliana]